MTAKQAAEMWDRDPTVIRDFCRRGLIPGAVKGKKEWSVPASDSPPVSLPTRAKLSEDERREIARRAHAGADRSQLARTFGVGRQTIYRMIEEYPAG